MSKSVPSERELDLLKVIYDEAGEGGRAGGSGPGGGRGLQPLLLEDPRLCGLVGGQPGDLGELRGSPDIQVDLELAIGARLELVVGVVGVTGAEGIIGAGHGVDARGDLGEGRGGGDEQSDGEKELLL